MSVAPLDCEGRSRQDGGTGLRLGRVMMRSAGCLELPRRSILDLETTLYSLFRVSDLLEVESVVNFHGMKVIVCVLDAQLIRDPANLTVDFESNGEQLLPQVSIVLDS